MATTIRQHHVRLSDASHQLLKELTERTGDPMSAILDRAIEHFWREQLFEEAERQWAAIQSDPVARAELEAEYALWDRTVADGLEKEPW
jgi:predicted transcriptional regulator